MTARRIFLLLVVVPAVVRGIAWMALPDGDLRLWIANVATVVYPLGLLLTVVATRATTSMRLLGAVGGLWCVGNAIWTVHEMVLRTPPFPTLADVGYAAAVPTLLAAVLLWPRDPLDHAPRSRLTPVLAAAVVAVAAFETMLVPVLDNGVHGFGDALLAFYPVGDLLVLAVAAWLLVLRRTRERGRLLLVAAGVVAFLVSDAAFAKNELVAQWLVDGKTLGWALAFVCWAAAAVVPPDWGARALDEVTEAGATFSLSLVLGAAVVHSALKGDYDAVGLASSLLLGLLFVTVTAQVWRLARRADEEALRLEAARRDLARAEMVRAATMDASRTGNCVFAETGKALFWNPAFTELMGIAPEADRDWPSFIHHLSRACRDAAAGGMIAAGAGEQARFVTAHGHLLEISFESLPTGETVVVVDDVTAREEETATRARFVAELVTAQEAETRRIAELLHDDAVQELSALALRLDLAALERDDDGLAVLAGRTRDVTASLRTLLVQMHPAVLESQGLAAAIESAGDTLRARGIHVSVSPYEHRHAPETEQLVYRLVQEVFANANKHAAASRVDVALECVDGILVCRIDDDGVGFDVGELETAVRRGHIGLHLLRERVDLSGGTVRVGSVVGSGTHVEIRLPSTQPSGIAVG